MKERVAIQLETLTRLADGFRESRGISGNLTTEQMITLAATPISSEGGSNKLASLVGGSATEITAKDLEGATSIGAYTFYKRSNLTDISFPNTITSIENNAFEECTGLTSITIPSGTTITNATSMLKKCTSLTSLTIEEGNNDTVPSYMCDNCTNLTNVILSDKIKSISSSAFASCANLTSIILPTSLTKMGSYAFQSTGLISLDIPDNTTSIGPKCFQRADYLRNVNISPNTKMTSIGNSAFYYCGLETITLPNKILSILTQSFASCPNLQTVRMGNGMRSIGGDAFQNCPALTDIYIDAPEDSISGAPWGATNATIHWNTPLPTEE